MLRFAYRLKCEIPPLFGVFLLAAEVLVNRMIFLIHIYLYHSCILGGNVIKSGTQIVIRVTAVVLFQFCKQKDSGHLMMDYVLAGYTLLRILNKCARPNFKKVQIDKRLHYYYYSSNSIYIPVTTLSISILTVSYQYYYCVSKMYTNKKWL